jgi:pilus assembly protein Flp/PilA
MKKDNPMITRKIAQFLRADDGVTAPEYGLITALIAIAVIVQVGMLGSALHAMFDGPAGAMDGANVTVASEPIPEGEPVDGI